MIRRRAFVLVLAAILTALAGPSAAGPRLADLGGHITLGYAKLFVTDSPGGSLSVGAGIDHRVSEGLRAGFDLGYHLLGSRILAQGSVTSGIDYSLLEALAQLRWAPGGGGPQVILSGGPGLFVARANLASTPVAILFSREAVEQTRVGFALGVTVAKRRVSPVRLGLEAGLRVIPIEPDNWTLATARVAILN
jgi:hypothetical protein